MQPVISTYIIPPSMSRSMSFQILTSTIKQCLEPGSRTRSSLANALQQLLDGVKTQKRRIADPAALLMNVTVVVVQVLVHPVLADRERDLTLDCLLETLTPDGPRQGDGSLRGVFAIVIEHLRRVLLPLMIIEVPRQAQVMPEPTRLLAVRCWRQLFAHTNTVFIPQMHQPPLNPMSAPMPRPCTVSLDEYVQAYIPQEYMSMVVSGLLDNAELGDDRSLRLAALDTLADCCNGGLLGGADRLELIFPGIASVLARVALGRAPVPSTPKADSQFVNDMRQLSLDGQHYRKPPAAVRARAIDALAAAVVTVYGDVHKQPSSKSTAMGELASRARLLATASIVQNKAADTDDDPRESDGQLQFQRLLRRLAELRHTEHLVIASALEALFANIVLSCASMLPSPAFSTAAEACLILAITHKSTGDDSDTLCRIADKCWTEGMGPVYRHRIGELAESCFSLFEQHITGNSESQRRDVLCLLAGYMRVLGPSDTQSLMLQWWSTRGVLSLIASLTVSLPGTSLLISEVSSTSDPKESVDYVLDFYRTPELKLALDRFVRQVVESFTARGLRTLLIGLLETQPDNVHSQILWLLSRITSLGESEYKDGEDAEYQPVVEYIASYFNKLQSVSDEETSDSIQTIDAASQDVLQSCMILNTISTVVPRIGTSIAYYMDSLLFPLLETTTAQSPVVREQAQQALAVVARTSGTVSVPDMLRSNIDYIVEGCSRQLRTVDLHPKVFNILIGCVDLVGEGILLYMDDVVEDTLDVCESWMDDDVMMTSALRFLEVVTRTVSTSQQLLDQDTSKLLDDGQNTAAKRSKDAIGDVLDELQKTEDQERLFEFTTIGSDDVNDDAGMEQDALANTDVAGVDDPSEEAAGNPLAIKITLVAQNFLSHNGAQQLVSLKILQNTLLALRNTRDLLPLINEVWPALTHRLAKGRDDHYVLLAACDVADTVCRAGSAWMRQRVRDDLWVHFRRILAEASRESLQRMSSECELVRRVICTMTTVVQFVPLDDVVAWDLVWLALKVVDNRVLEPFVIVLLSEMMPVYGDKVWLIVAKLGRTATSPEDIPDLGISVQGIRAPPNIAVLLGML